MENLLYPPTNYTPKVSFNSNSGILELDGTSIPEDTASFFQPLMSWIDLYINCPAPNTTLIFKLEYFNTSSTVFMLRLMQRITKLQNSGKTFEIHWYYKAGDEDLLEAGKDFAELAKTKIKLLSY